MSVDAAVVASAGAAGQRIDSIESIALSFPLAQPFRAAIRLIDSTDLLLVRLRTSDGACGHGYAFGFGREELRPIQASVELLAPVLVGRGPIAIERLWADMHRALALAGAGGPALAALSALDMALWDLAGQLCGLPLHRMLGGARDAIPVYGSGGSLALEERDLVAEAVGFAELGYGAFKFKLGRGPDQDLARLRAVRRAVGDGMRLIVDANQQWTPKQAIRAAQRLAECDPWWLEEPVAATDVAGCAEVRRAAPMEVATGESVFGVAEAARFITSDATDILMPNLQRVGGITGWRKLAAAAELRGRTMASHVYAEIGVHLMCGVPNGLVLELLPWWPQPFGAVPRVRDGMAVPPDGPGLGLAFDPDRVAAHRVELGR